MYLVHWLQHIVCGKEPLMSFMNNSCSSFCPSPKFHNEQPVERIKKNLGPFSVVTYNSPERLKMKCPGSPAFIKSRIPSNSKRRPMCKKWNKVAILTWKKITKNYIWILNSTFTKDAVGPVFKIYQNWSHCLGNLFTKYIHVFNKKNMFSRISEFVTIFYVSELHIGYCSILFYCLFASSNRL